MGIHKFLQKHKMNNIERTPGSRRPTKMTAAVKPLLLSTFRPRHDSEDSPQVSRCSGLDVQRQCLLPVDSKQNKVKRLQWAQEHFSEGVAATGRKSLFIVLFSD